LNSIQGAFVYKNSNIAYSKRYQFYNYNDNYPYSIRIFINMQMSSDVMLK